MWYILIAIIIFIIVSFSSDYNKENKKVAAKGGIEKMYPIIIEHILSQDKKSKVIYKNNNSIILGSSNISGSIVFKIYHTFENITIQYCIKNKIFGNHKIEWIFNNQMEQEKIIEKMDKDICDFNNRIMSKIMEENIN